MSHTDQLSASEPDRPSLTARLPRLSLRASWIIYVGCVVFWWLCGYFRSTWETYARDEGKAITHLEQITILHPAIGYALRGAMLASAILLLAFAFLAYAWPVVRHPAIALLLVLAVFPFAAARAMFADVAPWRLYGSLTASDGQTYWFCDSSFLQGQTMALVRMEDQRWFGSRYRALGDTNGDSPRFYATLIRPAQPGPAPGSPDFAQVPMSPIGDPKEPPGSYGRLVQDQAGTIYGLRSGTHCYFTFDPPSQRFVAQESVWSTSPFALLNADDEPWEGDVRELTERIKKGRPNTSGVPTRSALQDGLQHPNPRVRAIAAELLRAM